MPKLQEAMTADKPYWLSVKKLQWVVWIGFTLFLVFYNANKWVEETRYAVYSAIIASASYLPAVYGNANFLWPRFFEKRKIYQYLFFSVAFIGLLVVLRMFVEEQLLMPLHNRFYNWNISHFSLTLITVSLAYLFGAFLRMAINYVSLSRTQEALKRRQAQTELDLLKQQVQPHFLFNTLNNIYSLAHAKSDNTTVAIDKLANIMRYFTEDAPCEKVSLQTEINFINNYILLEQMRMPYPVRFEKEIAGENAVLPPMLLMPFIENLFKHGVDKTKPGNEALIKLVVHNGTLQYRVKNKLQADWKNGNGTGLSNLKKRLDLLYKDGYTMTAQRNGVYFDAFLEIPL
jgi:sensor histidine kinase YesM